MGVFVSYTRADQALARRLRNGLASLGINVVWDESMPGVDWQEYLDRSINGISAVVVLWTALSKDSKSVRDEARLALNRDKLVNVMSGIDKPDFPFERINGLSIDGWVGGTPHSGWRRVVETLDARLVLDGKISRAGEIVAALDAQIKNVAHRRFEIAGLDRELRQFQKRHPPAGTALSVAEKSLAHRERQIEIIKGIDATKNVMAAAWSDREVALADVEQCRATLTEIEYGMEQIEERGRAEAASLTELLASIGAPLAAKDHEERHHKNDGEDNSEGRPEHGYGPRLRWLDLRAVRYGLAGLLAVGLASSLAMAFLPGTKGANAREQILPQPQPQIQLRTPPKTTPALPFVDWIEGGWVQDKANASCASKVQIALAQDRQKLIFRNSGSGLSDLLPYRIVDGKQSTLAVGSNRYTRIDKNRMRLTSADGSHNVGFKKCPD